MTDHAFIEAQDIRAAIAHYLDPGRARLVAQVGGDLLVAEGIDGEALDAIADEFLSAPGMRDHLAELYGRGGEEMVAEVAFGLAFHVGVLSARNADDRAGWPGFATEHVD